MAQAYRRFGSQLTIIEKGSQLAGRRRCRCRRRLSEDEAQRLSIPIRIARLPIAVVLRARTTSETRGFMKALVEAEGDRILGFTMIGAEAGEVMAVLQTAMLANLPFTVLRDAIIAHPTIAEGLIA
jgi:pyruvate/2-oxoglutarate dehydrogenase complex dihydrolipoamide dehydrogenase (E3) component